MFAKLKAMPPSLTQELPLVVVAKMKLGEKQWGN